MKLKLITPPTSEPVTLDEAKDHLRVDSSDEDTLITALIKAARQWCESFTHRSFMDQTWRVTYPNFGAEMWLPRGPLYDVEHVKYTDTDGAEQTVAESVYRVVNDSDATPAQVVLGYDQTWPSVRAGVPDGVRITYRTGYADLAGSPTLNADGVPQAIKQAVLLVIGDLFEHREARLDMQSYENPTVDRLLWPYRDVRL